MAKCFACGKKLGVSAYYGIDMEGSEVLCKFGMEGSDARLKVGLVAPEAPSSVEPVDSAF